MVLAMSSIFMMEIRPWQIRSMLRWRKETGKC